jgi:hypothetical protein
MACVEHDSVSSFVLVLRLGKNKVFQFSLTSIAVYWMRGRKMRSCGGGKLLKRRKAAEEAERC